MDDFLAIITSFPTIVFTFAMVFMGAFWVLSIIGVVDLDAQLDLDISHETDASGVGELSGFLMRWGLGGIPITVVLSVLIGLSWLFCYFGSAYLLPFLPGAVLQALGGLVLIAICLIVSFPITAMSLKPTTHLFVGESAITNEEIVGMVCEVRSGEVNEDFGQGLVNDQGAGLLIDIRAKTPNDIKRGDKVALISYDAGHSTYQVMPEEEFMKL